MSQFLRPDSDIVRDNLHAGTYTDINEVGPGDETSGASIATEALSVSETAQYICGLSNPLGRPRSGTSTCRYRVRRQQPSGTCYCQVFVMQGDTIIAADAVQTLTISYVNLSFNPDLSAVTDWNDLRIACNFSGAGPSLETQGFLSWAELEIPDPLPPSGMMLMF